MKIDLRRKRDLGKILDDSFAVYRAHFGTLLAISLLVVVPVYLLVFGVGLGYLWSDYDVAGGSEVDLSAVGETFAGLAAQILVVTPLVTAMTVHLVRTAADGKAASAREAIATGLDLFPKLLAAIALTAVGIFGGFMLLIVPGVILAVRWLVVSQVVVVEGTGGAAALRRSFDLTRDRFWAGFLVLIVMLLLVGVLSAILVVPLQLAAEEANTMALILLGNILSSALFLPLTALAYTLFYYSLIAEKEGAAPAGPAALEPADAGAPSSLPGVPGTFGDGWAPPRPPGS